MPTKDRTWFERKVREFGDALRVLPRPRQRALLDALDADDDPGARARAERSQPSPRDTDPADGRGAVPSDHAGGRSDGGDGTR